MRLSTLKIKPPPIEIPPIVFIGAAGVVGTATGLSFSKTGLAIGISTTMVASTIGMCVKSKKVLIIVLVFATAGLYLARSSYFHLRAQESWIIFNDGDLVKLCGTVCSKPKTTRRTNGQMSGIDGGRIETCFEFIARPTKPQLLQNNAETILSVRVEGGSLVQKGDQITAIGTLRRSLNKKKLNPRFFISAPDLIVVHTKKTTLRRSIEDEIRNKITSGISGKEGLLVKAIFFGDRGNNYQELSSVFHRAGLSHILAISGLHIAIIVVTILWLLRAVSLNRAMVFGSLSALTIVLFLIIEGRPPVLRAIFMVILFSSLQLRGQRLSGLGVLSMVVLVLLWLDPTIIKTAGFILSFSVVFGLCLLLPTLQWKLVGPIDNYFPIIEMARYKLSALWTVGYCAIIIVTPITLHLFGTASPVGIISNIGGVILLFILLVAGLIRLFVGWVHPALDELLVWLIHNTSSTMIEAASMCGGLPLGFIETHHTSIWWTISIIIVLFALVLFVRYRKRLYILFIIVAVFALAHPKEHGLRITTLHVGHGTCHIIQDGGETIIVDAGSRVNLDVGINTIAPTLKHAGGKKIKTIIVTHNDLDHCSGILDLIDLLQIEEILMTPYSLKNPTKSVRMIIKKARSRKISVNTITAGWKTNTQNSVIRSLWPLQGIDYKSSNESSVVLQIEAYGRRILLTGDISEKTISTITNSDINTVDVLELPHHGQWSEESVGLLNKLQPSVVIQSTSATRYARDKWRLPKSTNRFVTCVDGAITTTVGVEGRLTVETSYTNIQSHYFEDSSIN
ncbi:ComEC/Rec2 family competence protein [PVC group bacterium]|nr:ComEC/Rec2 family competence protein [PVC group bacterium]